MSKNLIMSLSGIRAIVGDTLDPQIALDIGMAFGMQCGKGPVILGGDTRVSHDLVKGALISGLVSVGTDVIYIGKVTTPTVQQMIRHYGAKGGLVITASHNPIMWNGIKVMNETGSFLDDTEYDALMTCYKERTFTLQPWDKIGAVTEDLDAIQKHIKIIADVLDITPLKTSGLRVLVDANNGAGAVADPLLLDALGVEYDVINPAPDGRFAHDPEPLKQNLTEMIETMKSGKYDIGFAQDADADRLVILDETGRFIGEDYSLGFCIDYVLSHLKDEVKKVVVNLSTSKVIESISSKYGATVTYTKIGETNVTQGLKKENAQVGGEGNGGVIYPKVGWGRDSLVGMVIALKYLAESKKSVSEIVSNYPTFVMSRDKVQVDSRAEVQVSLDKLMTAYAGESIDTQDGVKIMFEDSWLHVRPSNTEPIMRIFVEAPTLEQAKALAAKAKTQI